MLSRFCRQQAQNRFLRYVSHSNGSGNGGSFDQAPNHLRESRVVQSVHADIMHEPLKHAKDYFDARAGSRKWKMRTLPSRGKRYMTIAIGARFKDGVILCADAEYTKGSSKYVGPK